MFFFVHHSKDMSNNTGLWLLLLSRSHECINGSIPMQQHPPPPSPSTLSPPLSNIMQHAAPHAPIGRMCLHFMRDAAKNGERIFIKIKKFFRLKYFLKNFYCFIFPISNSASHNFLQKSIRPIAPFCKSLCAAIFISVYSQYISIWKHQNPKLPSSQRPLLPP